MYLKRPETIPSSCNWGKKYRLNSGCVLGSNFDPVPVAAAVSAYVPVGVPAAVPVA